MMCAMRQISESIVLNAWGQDGPPQAGRRLFGPGEFRLPRRQILLQQLLGGGLDVMSANFWGICPIDP